VKPLAPEQCADLLFSEVSAVALQGVEATLAAR
jgi:hypothetical protein